MDGADTTGIPYSDRRTALAQLDLNGPGRATADAFDDGEALFPAVCAHGLEGVVAKRLTSR